jgi:Protein of unknown function (DUF1453)
MTPANAQLLRFILPFVIVVPLLYFRMRKMTRPQPLKLGLLWLRPALVLLGCGLVLFGPDPQTHQIPHILPLEWAGLAVAAAIGAAAGWHYGKITAIEVHPENGTLMARGGMAAILVILALLVLKMGLKPLLLAEGGGLHLDVLLITDALIVFSAALFTVRALEMYLRAKKVMSEHQSRLPVA